MTIAVFALCSFAASVSTRAVDPMTALIAAHFAVPVATAALLSSAYALPFALFQPILGPIGDMWGRSRLLRVALWMMAFSLIAGAFAPSLWLLLALRFIGGIGGGGTIPSGMAMIGDRWSGEARQIAIGRFVGAGLAGQIIGGSVAGVMGEAYGWQAPLLLSGAIALVAAIVASFTLREPPDRPTTTFTVRQAIDGYKLVFANPKAYLCFSTVLAEGIALWGLTPFVADLMMRAGTGAAREAGFAIGSIGIGGLLFTVLLPFLLRTIGRTVMMALGGVMGAVGAMALALQLDWVSVALAFAVAGFGYTMLHNCIQAESVELAPTARSSSYSMHAFFFFTGQSLGPIIVGLLIAGVGPAAAMIACAVMFAVTGIAAGLVLARLSAPPPR